jgi:hypothetical protein
MVCYVTVIEAALFKIMQSCCLNTNIYAEFICCRIYVFKPR